MLLFASVLILMAGAFVAIWGEEHRVRWWFLLMCASTAGLTAGLWVELHLPEYALLAARINMTNGLVLALTGCSCVLIM